MASLFGVFHLISYFLTSLWSEKSGQGGREHCLQRRVGDNDTPIKVSYFLVYLGPA